MSIKDFYKLKLIYDSYYCLNLKSLHIKGVRKAIPNKTKNAMNQIKNSIIKFGPMLITMKVVNELLNP